MRTKTLARAREKVQEQRRRIPVIAFFNNKGGVGKTSLVYHTAHMLAELGSRVVAADLDPQGNLSAACLEEERLEELWPENQEMATIFGAVRPLKRGVGDVMEPLLEVVSDNFALIPGDMALSDFEDDLSQVWPKCLDRDERAFRVMPAFWRVLQNGGEKHSAHVILVDLGPNLGAINRAALIAADFVVIPLGPDLFSLEALTACSRTIPCSRRSCNWDVRIVTSRIRPRSNDRSRHRSPHGVPTRHIGPGAWGPRGLCSFRFFRLKQRKSVHVTRSHGDV